MKGLTIATPPRSEWFPIGSIYISVNTTNPGTIFGGTWEQIKDKFMLCSGDTYSNGSTGGSATHLHGTQGHTLTIAEIPSHVGHLYGNAGGVDNKGDASGVWLAANNITQSTMTTSYGWNYKNNEYYPVNRSLGGGSSHSHGNTTSTSTLPPYLAVTVWKRIA